MKSISLKDLKENLSKYTEDAAHGETIQVTKYNKPFIYLTGASQPSLNVGSRVGKGTLRSVLSRGTNGKYLKVLLEDRKDQNEES